MAQASASWIRRIAVMVAFAMLAPVVPTMTAGTSVAQAAAVSNERSGWAWGLNSRGQLGIGSTSNQSLPTQMVAVAVAKQWDTLSAGFGSACGLTQDDSAVYCWGWNDSGQLGNGTMSDDSIPQQIVNGEKTSGSWAAVWAGGSKQTCALATDDSAYCWGSSANGQLGNGSTSRNDSVPTRVLDGANLTGTWKSISPGNAVTCGVATDDSAYCWGLNTYGQLGNNSTVSASVPVRVVNGQNPSGRWRSVASGEATTCGVAIDDSAYCWGYNGTGEIGNNTTSGLSPNSQPIRVFAGQNTSGGWKFVAAGQNTTCGIGLDDSAYCWGFNNRGQMGDGGTTNSSAPRRALIPGGLPVRQLSVATNSNFQVTVCALVDDSGTLQVYCWGNNDAGQLGLGTVDNLAHPTPTLISSNPARGVPLSVSSNGQSVLLVVEPWATPTVTSIAPTTGSTAGGTPVTITGTGFRAGASATIGGVSCDDTVLVSPTEFTCSTGARSAGTVDVVVTNSDAQSGIGTNLFTYVDPTPPPNPPGAPSITSATPGDGTASIAFTAPASDGGAAITNYEYSLDGGTWVPLSPASTTSPFIIMGLTNGQSYSVSLRAENSAGAGTASAAVTVTPSAPPAPTPTPTPTPMSPGAPTGVSAVPGDGQVTVAWQVPASSGSFPITNYRVIAQPGGAGCVVAVPLTSCVITGLTNGQSYTFTVEALNGAGWGPRSSPSEPVTPFGPVVVELELNRGTRVADGRHDRIRATGSSVGVPEGARLTAFIRYSGQSSFQQGKATITVQSDGSFSWTRQIRRNSGLAAYVAWQDYETNRVFWAKLR